MSIKVMNEQLSNKIAAGEVVERPKSIVKELVENALDAQATQITITVEESGVQSITVQDDGLGMSADDALLSFQRHATSKIFSEDDLFQIHTLGFRGEALAAISSVSKITMHTGQANQPSTYIQIDGGNLITNEERNAIKGTTITVNSLFYNTPARLKHLKSLQTELSHITEYIQKMALARPDVRFEMISNGNLLFKTYGSGQLDQTLAMIYGNKLLQFLFPVETADNDFVVRGMITHPQMQRSSNKVINLSINQRSVRSFGINQAVLSGYGNLIPKGTYPIVALDIEVDTKLVDVNVHPAKLEVRLSQEKQLERLIQEMIRNTLAEQNLIYLNTSRPQKIQTMEQVGLSLNNVNENHTKTINYPNGQSMQETHQAAYKTQLTHQEQQATKTLLKELNETPKLSMNDSEQVMETGRLFTSEIGMQGHTQASEDEGKIEDVTAPVVAVEQLDERHQLLRELSIIGQYDATYILAQHNHNLFLIDQHAAQERIKYEEHMKAVQNMETIAIQPLLLPLTLHLEHRELNAMKEYQQELQQAGITFEEFGQFDIRVTAVPSWIKQENIETYVRKSIDCITMYNTVDSAQIREKELIMLSCKYSIKAHDVLSKDEMEALLVRLSEMDTPFTCPHGRPIIVEHSKYEVERWFKRA